MFPNMDFYHGIGRTFSFLLILLLLQVAVCPPVTQKKKGVEDNTIDGGEEEDPSFLVEYNRYLKEVVTALESDQAFKTKMEKAEEGDIRSGKIADELEYVNHHVRTKLDEIKRSELERLRHLATKEYELRHGMDTEHLKIPPEHLDLSNPHTFEIEDLRKLILKTTADLAEADRKRREEFKEYEMQKEFEKQEKLKTLDEDHKKEMLKELEEKEKKHKQHDPLHHPGSKQQLEEVWEKQDHMESQDFNPKTFFHLHDLDGNGVWDADEVKALFLKELDKMYTPGAAEDDMRERIEELERMREHVFKEADTNKDGLISYEEFLAQTQKPEYEKDQGWEGLDQQQIYTQDEYHEFERRRQEEIQRLIAQGVIPPSPYGMPPHGGYQQGVHGQHQQQQFPSYNHPGQVHPGMQQGQVHPGMQQGQVHPGMQQGQVHPGMQQGQVHPGMQQGQVHPGMQQGQVHPGMQQGQVHPGMQQGQVHPGMQQGQVHPGMQQGQVHPGMQQGQVPPQAAPSQGQPGMMAGQAPPGQMPPQSQTSQGNPSPAQTIQQGQNINIPPVPQHVPQPLGEMKDPIDVNKLSQDEVKNPPPQVQQVR